MPTLVLPVADTATVTVTHDHPPTQRPTLLDRLALRAALVLLHWSLRPQADPVRAHRALLAEQDRRDRERAWAERAARQSIF